MFDAVATFFSGIWGAISQCLRLRAVPDQTEGQKIIKQADREAVQMNGAPSMATPAR